MFVVVPVAGIAAAGNDYRAMSVTRGDRPEHIAVFEEGLNDVELLFLMKLLEFPQAFQEFACRTGNGHSNL